LSYSFKEKNYKKGAYIYREGDKPVDGVYFLIKGTLERVKEDPYEKIPQHVLRGENLKSTAAGEETHHELVNTLSSGPHLDNDNGDTPGNDLHPLRRVIPALGMR